MKINNRSFSYLAYHGSNDNTIGGLIGCRQIADSSSPAVMLRMQGATSYWFYDMISGAGFSRSGTFPYMTAGTYDGLTYRFYLNDTTQVATYNLTVPASNTLKNARIGDTTPWSTRNEKFNGDIYGIAIYDRNISITELSDLMTLVKNT